MDLLDQLAIYWRRLCLCSPVPQAEFQADEID